MVDNMLNVNENASVFVAFSTKSSGLHADKHKSDRRTVP